MLLRRRFRNVSPEVFATEDLAGSTAEARVILEHKKALEQAGTATSVADALDVAKESMAQSLRKLWRSFKNFLRKVK